MKITNIGGITKQLTASSSMTYKKRTFVIMNECGKVLSLDGKRPYIPAGGRKALETLLPIAESFSFVTL